MKKIILSLSICLIFFAVIAQEPYAYRLYDSNGHSISFTTMVNETVKSDVILFGELHDNPIAHWLQLELCHALSSAKAPFVLGAEMFEADNQLILDEYLHGLISQNRFENEIRLWNNYKTDYKPLIEFAKEAQIPFVATNIPRRYAAMVAAGGLESLNQLTPEAKSYMAPLPIEFDAELPGYKAMLSFGGMPAKGGSANLPKAQAIKDATMAWNIAKNIETGKLFIHFHGTYHSNSYEGIGWYLNRYNPELKQKTIATVLQDQTDELLEENKGLADYIIVVPTRMTRTY